MASRELQLPLELPEHGRWAHGISTLGSVPEAEFWPCWVCHRGPTAQFQFVTWDFGGWTHTTRATMQLCGVCSEGMYRAFQTDLLTARLRNAVRFPAGMFLYAYNHSGFRAARMELDDPSPAVPEADDILKGRKLRNRPSVRAFVLAGMATLTVLGNLVG